MGISALEPVDEFTERARLVTRQVEIGDERKVIVAGGHRSCLSYHGALAVRRTTHNAENARPARRPPAEVLFAQSGAAVATHPRHHRLITNALDTEKTISIPEGRPPVGLFQYNDGLAFPCGV
jgi:hypothetical protein